MIIPSFKHGIIRVPRLISTHNITNTGSQNYTVPAGTIYLEIEMVGAGGGGGAGRRAFSGRANSNNSGAGGGGGGLWGCECVEGLRQSMRPREEKAMRCA